MSNKQLTIGLVVAILLALGGYFYPSIQQAAGLGSASACTDGYTCFTNLETQGNSLIDGTSGITGNTSITGQLAVTATTTLADTVKLTNPGLCINFFATSTATQDHLTASTTGSLPLGAAGVMTFDYGACTN